MVTLLCMPEARLPMLCANYRYIQSMLCLPPGTMHGFTVVCMQSSLRKARICNPWGSIVCPEQSMDCLDPCFAHDTIHGLRAQSTLLLLRNLWIHRLRRTIYGRIVPIYTLRITYALDHNNYIYVCNGSVFTQFSVLKKIQVK